MTAKSRKTQKKPVDTEVKSASPFELLSVDQWRYITARIENPEFNIDEAANHIRVSPKTVYNWPKYVNEAYETTVKDLHGAVIRQRKQALMKAIRVKISGLDSADENIRQKVATEILESELGKAAQPLTGKDGAPIQHDVTMKWEALMSGGSDDDSDPFA